MITDQNFKNALEMQEYFIDLPKVKNNSKQVI